jgi:hypothetical protein
VGTRGAEKNAGRTAGIAGLAAHSTEGWVLSGGVASKWRHRHAGAEKNAGTNAGIAGLEAHSTEEGGRLSSSRLVVMWDEWVRLVRQTYIVTPMLFRNLVSASSLASPDHSANTWSNE